VTTLATLVEQHARAGAPDVPWFHRLVGDWQLIADLAFADVVLWLPTEGPDGFVALSHARPSSSGTLFYRDFIGQPVRGAWRDQVDDAFRSHRIVEATHPEPGTDGDTRVRAVPVARRVGDELRTVAVITTHSNVAERTPSRQELTFKQCADDLLGMMTVGDYPDESAPTGHALVAADGSVDPAIVVLGIPASTTQPGSAIGATPGKPSPLLAGADVAAKQVLRRRGSRASTTPAEREERHPVG